MDYDVIICADCLFFDEGRPQLLECLKKKLKAGGTAIIVAPSRSGTFEVFFVALKSPPQEKVAKIKNVGNKILKKICFMFVFDMNTFSESQILSVIR